MILVVLQPLALIGDKPMIWHTYTNSLKCGQVGAWPWLRPPLITQGLLH